ncbi:MAG: DarT ssDNA thymidine ADP-ribosyltransferase family protein [Solirubrobacterales bacterium]
MFADEVEAPQDTWRRQGHPDCCTTDVQAEVLVHRQVPLRDVLGIIVESTRQAADTYVLLHQLRAPVDDLPVFVCPDFYDPPRLAAALRSGRRPVEETWHPPTNAEPEAAGE